MTFFKAQQMYFWYIRNHILIEPFALLNFQTLNQR